MKPRLQNPLRLADRSSRLLRLCTVTCCGLAAGHAADINTTGGTTVLSTDNPQNRYQGNGILQISTDAPGGDGTISLGSAFNTPVTEFAMTSGGLISIDAGVRLLNGGFARAVWTNNLADMTINSTGIFDMWDGQAVRVDALNGAGSIALGIGNANKELRVGVDNGSGTFSGNIAQSTGGTVLRLFKEGSGTQTFNGNLTAQIPRQYIINGGTVDLSSADGHSMTSQFLGSGNLTKSGAGALTISSASGALMVSGTTNVTGGSLVFGSEVSARANLVAATGTTFGLNFTGQATVGTLNLGGSGPLVAGIYDSTHATYGSYFTGAGQLNVLNGAVATGSGTWSSSTGGFWNVASSWAGGAIANGSGNTATIGAVSAVAITLDRNETLGHLVFQGNNHTLNGVSTLTLAGTTPTVTVASGTSSRIETQIAGGSGLSKSGAGTLTLASGNKTYTGGTAVSAGRLVLADVVTGTSNYSIASTATLELNYSAGSRTLSGGTISGDGNFVKSGAGQLFLGASGARLNINLNSGALIDVQAGLLRSEFANASQSVNGWLNNKADLNVASGAFFDIWDSNTIVDAMTGAGTINKGWNGTSSLTFGVDNGTGTFSGTISSVQSPPGGGYNGNINTRTLNLIKNGTGIQTLSGNVSPTGTVTVNAGTLQLAKTASLYGGADASWTAANINVKSAATLALNVDSAGTNGFASASLNTLLTNISVANTAVQGLQSGAILGIDTSNASGGTFTQGNAIADSTGSGSFHGAIGLGKLGTGTLVLDKANTYSGGTTATGGTLVLANNNAAGAGGIAVSGGSAATLQINSGISIANNITFSNTNVGSNVKREVAAASAYDVGTSGNLTSSFVGGTPDTTAKILAGTSGAAATTLTMGFSNSSLMSNDGARRSDIFSVSGTGSDLYVLQLTATGQGPDSLLAYYNGSIWDLAVTGNTGTNNASVAQQNFLGTFSAFQTAFGTTLSAYQGAYGLDTATNNLWAVVNYGGSFAAVPEPSSALVGLLVGPDCSAAAAREGKSSRVALISPGESGYCGGRPAAFFSRLRDR